MFEPAFPQQIQLMTGVNRVTFFGASVCFDIIVQAVGSSVIVGLLLYLNPGECFAASPETLGKNEGDRSSRNMLAGTLARFAIGGIIILRNNSDGII